MIQDKTWKRVHTANSEQLLLLAILAGSRLKPAIDRELHRRRFGMDHVRDRTRRR